VKKRGTWVNAGEKCVERVGVMQIKGSGQTYMFKANPVVESKKITTYLY